jgi:hypothetical protein
MKALKAWVSGGDGAAAAQQRQRITTIHAAPSATGPHARPVAQFLDLLLLAPDLQDAVLALDAVGGAEPIAAHPPDRGPRGDVGRAAGAFHAINPAGHRQIVPSILNNR